MNHDPRPVFLKETYPGMVLLAMIMSLYSTIFLDPGAGDPGGGNTGCPTKTVASS